MDINNSDFNQDERFKSDASGPTNEANTSFNRSDAMNYMKDFGIKGLQPFMGVISRYKVDLRPYLSAIDTGLRAAVSSLNQESSSEADREISKWFTQASTFITTAGDKLKSQNPTDLWHFFEEEARRQPGLMFSASYVAGLLFGRVGRHVGSQIANPTEPISQNFQTESLDTPMTSTTQDYPDSSNIH